MLCEWWKKKLVLWFFFIGEIEVFIFLISSASKFNIGEEKKSEGEIKLLSIIPFVNKFSGT